MSTVQDLIDQWRLHPDPEVGSCANQLAGWLRTQTPAPIRERLAPDLAAGLLMKLNEECEAQYARAEQAEAERDKYKTLAGIGTWHKDCRPNREMAARELAKSQAIIEKLADRITELESLAASRGGGDTRPPRQDEKP